MQQYKIVVIDPRKRQKQRYSAPKKVTNRQVQLIRAAACNGISHETIAERFGLSARYVHALTGYAARKNVLPFTDKHVAEALEMFDQTKTKTA